MAIEIEGFECKCFTCIALEVMLLACKEVTLQTYVDLFKVSNEYLKLAVAKEELSLYEEMEGEMDG